MPRGEIVVMMNTRGGSTPQFPNTGSVSPERGSSSETLFGTHHDLFRTSIPHEYDSPCRIGTTFKANGSNALGRNGMHNEYSRGFNPSNAQRRLGLAGKRYQERGTQSLNSKQNPRPCNMNLFQPPHAGSVSPERGAKSEALFGTHHNLIRTIIHHEYDSP